MNENRENRDLNNKKLKENLFETPKGYFEGLHDKIMNRVKNHESQVSLDSPELRENIFKVPEGYFENLPSRVNDSIQKDSSTKVIPLHQKSWVRYAAAAVALVAIIIFGVQSDDGLQDQLNAKVSDEAIIQYLYDEGINGLDILASVDGADVILEEFYTDEMNMYSNSEFDNPELEYDFEYFEY